VTEAVGQADFLHVRIVNVDGGSLTAELDGELSHATSGPALELLTDAINRGETRIVLDLNGLGFCDSAGITFLVHLQQRAADAGGWLRLAAPAPLVRQVLTVTYLDQTVPIYPSADQARNEPPPA
jgi:anti-sigma B factor antagonist